MSDVKMGQLLDESAGRDAVHVAIAPVVAAHILSPGEHVGLIDDDDRGRLAGRTSEKVGIVDPFLKSAVMPGERFYLFLYPNTITGLAHVWTHPAFDAFTAMPTAPRAETPQEQSRRWLEALAAEMDLTYNALMRAAERWEGEEEYTTEIGSEHWRSTFGGKEREFWRHYEVVTGRKPKDPEAHFFSCSC